VFGEHLYYWISRGVDDREVRADRIRTSVGAENTFSSDLTEFDAMVAELQPLIDKVWRHCDDKGSRGRTVTLKMKFIAGQRRRVEICFSAERDHALSAALLISPSASREPIEAAGPSSSANSRRAACSGSSDVPISPFGIDQAPSSLLRQ
jgi:DNA polymerase-4